MLDVVRDVRIGGVWGAGGRPIVFSVNFCESSGITRPESEPGQAISVRTPQGGSQLQLSQLSIRIFK